MEHMNMHGMEHMNMHGMEHMNMHGMEHSSMPAVSEMKNLTDHGTLYAAYWGHVTAGVTWVVMGVYRILRIAYLHTENMAKPEGERQYYRTILPFPYLPNYPVESVIKAMFTIYAMHEQYWIGEDMFDRPAGLMVHFNVYLMFFTISIVEILSFYQRLVPLGADIALYVVAFICQAIMFQFHASFHQSFESTMHTPIVIASYATAGCSAFLFFYPKSYLTLYPITALALVQGTWYFQMCAWVYNPYGPTKLDLHPVWIFVFFTWHIWMVIAFTLFSYIIFQCQVNNKRLNLRKQHQPTDVNYYLYSNIVKPNVTLNKDPIGHFQRLGSDDAILPLLLNEEKD